MVFHKGPNFDYSFIIKDLFEEFEGHFKYLLENNEKYITFLVPIKKNKKKKKMQGNNIKNS